MGIKARKRIGTILIPDFIVSQFYGLNTSVKNYDDLRPGESPDSLNWITGVGIQGGKVFGSNISLRGGYRLLGQTRINEKPVSGLGMGYLPNGKQVPFYSYGRHIRYYDADTDDTYEVGSNILPEAAENDDVAIVPYQSISGSWVLISSPNSSIIKISPANPSSYLDYQYYTYRGFIQMNQGRMFLWNKNTLGGNPDKTGLYLSYVDGSLFALTTNSAPFYYSPTTSIGTGDGTTKTFSGTITLPFRRNMFLVKIAAPIATPANISGITKEANCIITTSAPHNLSVGDTVIITGVSGMTQINNSISQVIAVISNTQVRINIDSSSYSNYTSGGTIAKSEIFWDDQNGKMVSNLGSKGTVDYITGAYSVTFSSPPINGQPILSSHYEEDSTNRGILDFSFTPGGRTNGQGHYFAQSDGSDSLQTICSLSNIFFCFHKLKTWQLQIPSDDTQSTNLIFRDKVGIPYWRSAIGTGDGIVYVDTLNGSYPVIRLLTVTYSTSSYNPLVVPESISNQLDLTLNGFDRAVVYEWGNYYLVSAKEMHNGVFDTNNDVVYIYNKITGYWDKLDYRVNVFANYNGMLLGGDSGSSNVFVLFSGFDDDGYPIQNYWCSAPSLLGVVGTKRFNRFYFRGYIVPSQSIDVYFSYDNSNWVKKFTLKGNSEYVSLGEPIEVGGQTVGSQVIGGGGNITAYPFEAEFPVGSDIFERVAVKFVATGIGYVEIDSYAFKDIRFKSRRGIPNVN